MAASAQDAPLTTAVGRNAAVRAALRRQFPGVPMVVRNGAGRAAMVRWVDGPSERAVEGALAALTSQPGWRWAVTLDRRCTLRFVAAACVRARMTGRHLYRESHPLPGTRPWPLPAPHVVGPQRSCVEVDTGADQLTAEHWQVADVALAITGGDGATQHPADVSWEAMTVAMLLHHHWDMVAEVVRR